MIDFTSAMLRGLKLESKGEYTRIVNFFTHPLADINGRVPLHRFILYETLNQPDGCKCHWCGYLLPWKTSLSPAYVFVVNADHLDGNKKNNDPTNLVPACWWCNANRSWAEKSQTFWSDWRRWMADVPPNFRPNLSKIGAELGLLSTDKNGKIRLLKSYEF